MPGEGTAAAIRLGAKPLGMALILLSPPVWFGIRQANIEWIPMFGFALPPPIGLLLLATKPQTGFAVGIFWLFEAWRAGGLHKVIQLCAPLTIAAVVSFAMYGFWPSHLLAAQTLVTGSFNASFFPYSLPAGLVLLFTAIKSRRMEWAMGASPCLSPYVVFYSWGSAFLALVRKPQQLAIAVMATWLIAVVQAFVL